MGADQSLQSHYFLDSGSSSELSSSPASYLGSLFKGNEISASFNLGGRKVVAVRGIEGSRLFHDPSSTVSAVGALPEHLAVMCGKGSFPPVKSVLLMEGSEHETAKKELLAALDNKHKLAAHCKAAADILVDTAKSWAGSSAELAERCNALALRVSARCCLGIMHPTKVAQLEDIAAGFNMFDVTGDPATAAMVRDALLSVIEEELEAEDAPGSDEIADSVLDVLIHSADSMNVATVALVALHVFLVTWHSLARAFQAAISTLNQHADVLAELKEENKTDGSAGSYLAVLEGHSLKMKAFVKELQRTNTLSPIPWRRLTAACDVGAAHLEEGTVVCLAVPLLHHDPSQYENPEKFDMTRFSKERAEDKKNSGFCWLPYGTGSKTKGHRCASEKLQESIIKMFGVMAAGMQWELEGSTWSIQ